MMGDPTAEAADVAAIVAEQREYARLGLVGRWRWRREHWGSPVGWRTMTMRSRRQRRKGK